MSKAFITRTGKVGFIIGSGKVELEYTNQDGSVDDVVDKFEVEIDREEATRIANIKSKKARIREAKNKRKLA